MKRWMTALALAVAGMPQALALRPFDGTDADVAQRGQWEFEFGYLDLLRAGGATSLMSPALVANVGLPSNSELVMEGRMRTGPGTADGRRTTLQDAAVSLKHVFRAGVLQDAQGPSVAAECGILLPSAAGERTGLACTGIMSRRVARATLHVNAAFARNREHESERALGVIAEGPDYGRMKPVVEALAGSTSGDVRTRSLLAGVIVTRADNLAFDLGLRAARVGGTRVAEIRAGLTWSPR